jgi:hypothetical protein
MAEFVSNNSKNFTLYYNFLEYWRIIMTNHPSIARVTQGDLYDIDTDEFPRYPLGNILITNVRLEGTMAVYACQLTIADKAKLKNNESLGSTNYQSVPFYRPDDVIDIHSNTIQIANDLLSFTKKSADTLAFYLPNTIDLVLFKDDFDNGLCGVVANFDVSVHNDGNACLWNLLEDNGSC